jgi:hypothetical protein
MFNLETRASSTAGVAHASIAFGRKRGYYRMLFENGAVDAATFAAIAGVPEHLGRAWLEEQRAAGVLRLVAAPTGDVEEYLLPGEFVPLLLGDRGQPELAGARALLAERRGEIPPVLANAGHDFGDWTEMLWSEHPSAF